MAVKVKVNPLRAGAAFRETENLTIEIPRGGKVVDRDGEMKRRKTHRYIRPGCDVFAVDRHKRTLL
jgi:hypothetical protein